MAVGGQVTAAAPAGPAGAPGRVVGIGTDLVDVERLAGMLERRSRLAERLFTPEELAYTSTLANAAPSLAGRFAVKEAVMKALGVGLGAVDWSDISVRRLPGGAPEVTVRGRAARLAGARGVTGWHVSISHTATVAAATVVAVA